MLQTIRQKFGLSSAALRYLAICLMLLDHVWLALVKPAGFWMTCVGRLAFPIFAFLIAEGFYHTSDRKKYALRLLVSGVISELPFNMLTMANALNPNHQNVMFTLLLGLLSLWAFQWAREKGSAGRYLLACMAFSAAFVAADRLRLDYGGLGMTMVVIFGLSRGSKWEKLLQAVGIAVLNFLMGGRTLFLGGVGFSIQNFATAALLPIWLYNGQRGIKNKPLQYGAYLFYPVHMGILAILRRLL